MDGLPPGYRPNFGVCLINSDNQVFVASRLNVPGAWQMPQGAIEDDEEPKLAAIKKLREETGVVSAEIIAEVTRLEMRRWSRELKPAMCVSFLSFYCSNLPQSHLTYKLFVHLLRYNFRTITPMLKVPNWLTYDFPPSVKTKVNRLWGGEWHGQAQKWFLMRLTKDDDSEINLANGEADTEFAEWKWASPEEVIEQAVDYKRPQYEEVMKTFEPYLNGSGISAKCKSTKW